MADAGSSSASSTTGGLRRAKKPQVPLSVTPAQSNTAFEAQQGRCGICGIDQDDLSEAFHADHDYDTGVFRGLLCPKHNKGLGCFDGPRDLLAAVAYLEGAPQPQSTPLPLFDD
jgi:hypothetical protein